MSDKADKDRQEGQAQAFESLAAATAVGFAVASRSMEMWVGMMSGFARASRELVAPHVEAQLKEQAEATPEPVEKESSVVDLAPRRKKSTPVQVKIEMRAPQAMEKPATVDDLKRIAGVGPKLEQVLNGFGIWTYAQIAGLQVEEIAWLDDTLGLNGRIDGDNWLEQAEALARPDARKKDVAAG